MLGNIVDTSAFIGLENCLSQSTCMEVIQKRRAIVVAVLSEQNRQLGLVIHDISTLATISAAQSAWAQERARTIALIHAK
jgi:chemotaxis signal transduction protein